MIDAHLTSDRVPQGADADQELLSLDVGFVRNEIPKTVELDDGSSGAGEQIARLPALQC